MEKRSKNILYIVIAIIGVLFLLLVVSRILHSKLFTEKEEEVQKNAVTVIAADNGTIRNTLFFTGDLHAEREVIVYPVVTGKVIRYNYKEGDRVAKGSTLVLLERMETWDEFKPVVVESPISGKVAINYLDTGELASVQTPLSMVVGGKKIRVSIKVTDVEFASIKNGMAAELTVTALPGKVFMGKVSKVAPVIRRETRTAPVEILFALKNMVVASGKQIPGNYSVYLQSVLSKGLLQDEKDVTTTANTTTNRRDLQLPETSCPVDLTKFMTMLSKTAMEKV